MKNLILAEKPSVASEFARALSAKRQEGYFESEDYVITFCVGHLLELQEPGEYKDEWSKWDLNELPMIPEKFIHVPNAKTAPQLKIVKGLLKRKDVDRVIVATDAGREGELIGRLVLNHSGVSSDRALRFWVSDVLNSETISAGLEALLPLSAKDSLYSAGYARQTSDWLIGMNLSRLMSLKLNGKFSVGRVQTAVLSMLCSREREIENFKPAPYYRVKAKLKKDGVEFFASLEHEGLNTWETSAAIEAQVEQIRGMSVVAVKSVKAEEKSVKPPLLLDLTTLQRIANKKLGLSAAKTLEIAQALYETHKCLSYPRTPSRVMGEASVETVKKNLENVGKHYSGLHKGVVWESVDTTNKRVFNDAKLEDHHALMPVAPPPAALDKNEKGVYELVVSSFFLAFHSAYEYEATEARFRVDEKTDLIAKGKRIIELGWKGSAVEEEEDEKNEDDEDSGVLPELQEGNECEVSGTEVVEAFTKPPGWFNEGSLLQAMANPKKYSEDDTDFGGIGIGTPATRAAVIEALIDREYVKREKKRLVVTKKGFHLFDIARQEEQLRPFTQVDETARWEQFLEKQPETFQQAMNKYVASVVERIKGQDLAQYIDESIGKCPVCGGPLGKGKKNTYCRDKECNFTIWHEVAGARLQDSHIQTLISGGTTKALKFKSKNGKEFEARLKIEDGDVKMDFSNAKEVKVSSRAK